MSPIGFRKVGHQPRTKTPETIFGAKMGSRKLTMKFGEKWLFLPNFGRILPIKAPELAQKSIFLVGMVVIIKVDPKKKLHSDMGVSRRFSESCSTGKLLKGR